MTKPQEESGEAAWHPSLRPVRTMFGNVSSCQESQRADPEDETTSEVRGKRHGMPASGLPGQFSGMEPTKVKEDCCIFSQLFSENEATQRYNLEEEARNGRWQQSLSLKHWPLWTSHQFGTSLLMPVPMAWCYILPGLWPLLCPPFCSVSPVSEGPRCFLVWLNVFNKDHFPVRQGDTSWRSVS
ncbi:uncharacterized protein [Symphalangus syndactylus]|uniref:uncharacterized protein isoform X1 n=1 Tax=Symphalangus syndactylus TaxID=9590 RepID=UPI003006E2E2